MDMKNAGKKDSSSSLKDGRDGNGGGGGGKSKGMY